MTVLPRDLFPSKKFIRKYYGWNWSLLSWLDVGMFRSSIHNEVRSRLSYILFSVPHTYIKQIDRDHSTVRSVTVFEGDEIASWLQPAFVEACGIRNVTPTYLSDLRTEYEAFVLTYQPFKKEWWEWFSKNGIIGIRFTATAKDFGNEPPKTLDQICNSLNLYG